jgi:hypothetical protein
MTNIKKRFGWRGAVLATVLIVATGAAQATAQASATRGPIVISYEKTCDESGHCVGTAGANGTIEMQATSFEPTRWGAKVTFDEWITVGGRSFTAEMKGYSFSEAGVVLLSGRVTEGSFVGARIYQRSELDPDGTVWTGKLLLLKTRR